MLLLLTRAAKSSAAKTRSMESVLNVFNKCITTNSITKLWRKSRVLSLLKPHKDPASPISYTPISLQGHTYKLFERLVLNRVAPFVDEHLTPEQAGSMPGKFCTSQLLNLTQFIDSIQFNQIYFNYYTSLHVNNYYNTLHLKK